MTVLKRLQTTATGSFNVSSILAFLLEFKNDRSYYKTVFIGNLEGFGKNYKEYSGQLRNEQKDKVWKLNSRNVQKTINIKWGLYNSMAGI